VRLSIMDFIEALPHGRACSRVTIFQTSFQLRDASSDRMNIDSPSAFRRFKGRNE
jgi:hypothetical protein